MKKLVFATNNKHKLDEVRALLQEAGVEVSSRYQIVSLSDIGCTADLPETSSTFVGNAMQKAEYVYVHYGLDCIADDSGLEVRALGMEPGVHSARYADEAGVTHNDEANIDKLLRNMSKVSDRTAQFRTVIVLLMGEERFEFEGICKGRITTERRGDAGFGYDPVFIPDGEELTFAEMSADKKNAISHRGLAVQKLVKFLKTSH